MKVEETKELLLKLDMIKDDIEYRWRRFDRL